MWMPMRSATIELLPVAMLPNGPVCTSAGVFSRVCIRFGLIASLKMTAIEPATCSSSAVTGVPDCGVADHDPAETSSEILEAGTQRQRGHHLRSRRDVEARLARTPSSRPPKPIDDVAQRPIVDVEDASPRDVVQVDARLVAVVQVGIEGRRTHVVRGGDGVHVAGEMQVEQLHRHDLAVAAPGGAALDAERRPHRRLAHRDDALLADVAEPLTRGRPSSSSCLHRAGSA